MPFEFKLPDIGEGVAEGEIVKWFVAEGDRVERDQPMVEVLTDKANVEIPAPRAGVILKILAKEGQTVPVESTLVVIGEPGEVTGNGGAGEAETAKRAPTRAAAAPRAEAEGRRKPARAGRGDGAPARGRAAGDGATATGEGKRRRLGPDDRVLAMPAVRRFASQHGVDLAQVEGTGSQGHILREDVERFLAGLKAAPVAAAGAAVAPAAREAAVEAQLVRRAPLPPIPRREPGGPEEEILPYRGVRRQIGKKMAQSVYTAPHYTYVEEVDADALVALRREGQSLAEARGLKLTYLPFIVKALVPALRAFPLLNAVLDEERQQIRLKKRFNIGIATSSDEGLIVPVLKDVDQLSILEIASEIRRLSEAARDRSITIEELKGSTFTITSLGPLGGLLATPIINFPEVAILGVHAIKQKPVVKDGQIVIGNVMNLSLSFDHRVVDGAVGAEFTQRLVRYLEDPKLLLLDT
ncbi:MAG TPA: dihydrolipoamide acetyltransferase family protein [Gemmatimonadota bacterium]|jgi:pyruvate dehydrogenase E2 component (dihydrolipoamide acetyltransferase)